MSKRARSLAERLARPEVLAMASYATAFDEGARTQSVKLDANENPFPGLGARVGAVGVNRYPEPQAPQLRARLAALYGVEPDMIALGRGADDGIDACVRVFCAPGDDAIAVCPPTFDYYETAAALQGARVIKAPLKDGFVFDADGLIEAVRRDGGAKLVFICAPMSPTGGAVLRESVISVLDALPETLIVVDEAYVEFSEAQSFAGDVAARENLIVLRTLSKAYGLAGARIGAAIAQPATIELLRKAIAPYPVAGPCIEMALETLAPARMPGINSRIAEIISERARVSASLEKSRFVSRVHPSATNFLFVETRDVVALRVRLNERAIAVRWRENIVAGGMRITIGTPDENALLLDAFEVGKAGAAQRRADAARKTNETDIAACVNLDADGPVRISTGVGFFDHMLEQVANHGGFALSLSCEGDLHVDAHHVIEDCAIVLGKTLREALGEKTGLRRYGASIPMDEADAEVLIDLSGRPICVFDGGFSAAHIGAYPTEMTAHVVRSLADHLGAAIHVRVRGENDHHKTEAVYKGIGRALREAIRLETSGSASTKGVIE